MKKLIFALLILSGCSQKDHSKEAADQIAAADQAMSDKASKEGFFKVLLEYADTNVVKPEDGAYPVIGKKDLQTAWSSKKDFTNLSWKPYRSEASAAGDLGYSIGNWTLTKPDTILYGNYVTIWKKQKDGSWKFVFDAGNGTPGAPKELQTANPQP